MLTIAGHGCGLSLESGGVTSFTDVLSDDIGTLFSSLLVMTLSSVATLFRYSLKRFNVSPLRRLSPQCTILDYFWKSTTKYY